MFYRLCHVHETSPGTHTFFPTYTCPVYCWRSVQLLDFGLFSNLIHASQPIRTTFTGQCFASGFLQTPPHDDALALGCTLPTAGRVRDFHPLERAPAGRTKKKFLETRNFSEASTRFELVIEVLQTFALPLGYDAIFYYMSDKKQKLLSVK